ncbi:MAG: hypothetical protein PHS32_12765 [Rhodoferax sp.]|uniref:hypothetical protein n=1 Tax=Rhodoferax sp. TaxID=50421 RepID=UPI00260A91A9|nr:hypothetical protein [Rhodoferax sp.]MDD5334604.1 hypothetical protein [Rhodoferax sp.]
MHRPIAAIRNGLMRGLSYVRVWVSLFLGLFFVCAAYWLAFPRLEPMFVWPATTFVLLSGAIGAVFEWHARAFGTNTRATGSLTPGKSFAVVFLILAASSALSTVIGWFNSVDVKGWWPFVMAVSLFLDCVYSLIFVALSRLGRPFGLRFVIVYNAALGLLVVVQTILFYTSKAGTIDSRSYFLQLARSDSCVPGLYGLFLLCTAVLALTRRGRPG